jgi:hypothetical protein
MTNTFFYKQQKSPTSSNKNLISCQDIQENAYEKMHLIMDASTLIGGPGTTVTNSKYQSRCIILQWHYHWTGKRDKKSDFIA